MAAHSPTSVEAGLLRVSWWAPPECPQASDVLARVRALLGREVVTVLHHALEANALVMPLASGRFKLELEIREGADTGSRSIEADTCQEISQAGALVIALTVNPELLEAGAHEQPQPSASPSQSAAPASGMPPTVSSPAGKPSLGAAGTDATQTTNSTESSKPTESEANSARRRQIRFGIGLSAIADAGSLPGNGAGSELSVDLEWDVLRVELAGIWLPPRRGLSPGFADVGGSIQLYALALRACVVAGRGTWAGGGCAAFELGRLHAEAFGAADNRSGDIPWLSPSLALIGRHDLSRVLSLRVRIEGLIPLDRSEFILENVGPVHAPARLVGRLGVGLNAHFW